RVLVDAEALVNLLARALRRRLELLAHDLLVRLVVPAVEALLVDLRAVIPLHELHAGGAGGSGGLRVHPRRRGCRSGRGGLFCRGGSLLGAVRRGTGLLPFPGDRTWLRNGR